MNHHTMPAWARAKHPLAGRAWASPLHPARWAKSPAGPEPEDRQLVPDREAAIARLEAVLFLACEPMSTRKLASVAQLADGTEARLLAQELGRRYEGTSLEIVELAGGLQLVTRPELHQAVERLRGEANGTRLSPPAMETLTVVAYLQPVPRAEVEAIRGVRCGELLRVLMEAGLLRIVGRSESLGRPFLYGTTRSFLQVFGLRRLDDLPDVDQIRVGLLSRSTSDAEAGSQHAA